MPAQPEVMTIRAAGGVVWRPTDTGCEVCLVHRPRYDDWSLPKGKLEAGEHPLLAAVREVAEEADVRAVPQVRLPQVRYVTRSGSPKAIDYWSMRAVADGGFEAHTEVDEVRWLPVDAAVRLVSYAHDVRVLRAFAALAPVTAVLVMVRHTGAGERSAQPEPDPTGPLDEAGVAQAQALAPLLALVRPHRLLAAPVRHCLQTLDPLARLLDLPVEADATFDAPGPGRPVSASAAAERLSRLASAGTAAVVCGRGEGMAAMLARLSGAAPERFATAAGTGWLLAFSAGRLVATDRVSAEVW